jgi:plastocyanin
MLLSRHHATHGLIFFFLLFAVLGAAGCGQSTNPTNPTPPSNPGPGTGALVTVFITNSVYSPNPMTMKVGQQVNWKNNDTIEHTATFDNGMYESGNIPPLSAHDNPLTMNTAGTFTYHCRIHSGMTGSIVVQP